LVFAADHAVVHPADAHHEVLRLAPAVHPDLHVQAVDADRGPAPGRPDRDPGERKIAPGRTGGGAHRVEPRIGPGGGRHLIRLDHARPELRVIPAQLPVGVEAHGRAQRGQGRQVEGSGLREPRIDRAEQVEAGPGPVAGEPAEQLRGPVTEAGREAGQHQHVVRNRRPGGGRVVGLHRVVHVGQPGLGDLDHITGQRAEQALDLLGADCDPGPATAHPHRRGQPEERAQVLALPDRIGEREPHRARPGRGRQSQGECLQQRPRPGHEPALVDQQVAVPGEPRHRGQRRAGVVGQPQHADAQPLRAGGVPVGLVGVPGWLGEAGQRPGMRGGQRRHDAERVLAGPGRRAAGSVQVMLVAITHRRGRGGQLKIADLNLPLDRFDRHISPTVRLPSFMVGPSARIGNPGHAGLAGLAGRACPGGPSRAGLADC
jgi:hypothetical protein